LVDGIVLPTATLSFVSAPSNRFRGLLDPIGGIGGAQCIEHLQQGRLIQG
jgi:hypothetical protein